MFGIRGV
jgi:hypothetical protein